MATKVVLSMIDAHGRTTTRSSHYTGTAANADANAQLMTAAVGAISDMGIVKNIYELKNVYTGAGNKKTVEATSNKDAGFTLGVLTDAGNQRTLQLPSPKKDGSGVPLYITNGAVDITAVPIVDYVKLFGAVGYEGLATAGVFTLANGERVVELLYGTLDK